MSEADCVQLLQRELPQLHMRWPGFRRHPPGCGWPYNASAASSPAGRKRADTYLAMLHLACSLITRRARGCTNSIFLQISTSGVATELMHPTGPTSHGGAVLIASDGLHPTAKRFAIARGLWHFGSAPSSRFLLTAAHTDRQKVERAFAAELLAPATGVARFVNGYEGYLYLDELEPIADHFLVSPQVIRHQVENQLNLEVVSALE
jgi:IrrE N-terminal-like domain